MSEAPALRVVVVDDSDVVRMKLRQLLIAPAFDVVGEAPDVATGLQVIAEASPDVVVMDLQMPGMSGIDATWRLGGIAPDTEVLMLTVSDDEDDVADAVMAGAKGYVLKGSTDSEIASAVQQVAAGHSVISPAVAGALVRRGNETDRVEAPADDAIQPEPEPVPAETSRPPLVLVPEGDAEPVHLAAASAPAREEVDSVPPPMAQVPAQPLTDYEVAAVPPPPPENVWVQEAPTDASFGHEPGVPGPVTAAVVLAAGLLLTAAGQGEAITDGSVTTGTVLRIALNFAVVYAVWRAALALSDAAEERSA